MLTRKVVVGDQRGIHLTPAVKIAEKALEFQSVIMIRAEGKHVDAKQMFALLGLKALPGTEAELEADGIDEEEAIEALTEVLRKCWNASDL